MHTTSHRLVVARHARLSDDYVLECTLHGEFKVVIEMRMGS